MPMLIFNCRTRLFLAFVQQRTILGGTRTLPLQEQLMIFTLFPTKIQYRNFYGVGHLICYMRGTYPQNVPGANPLLTAYPAIASLTSRIDVAADYWNHISFSKKDGTFLLHLNGELKDSRAVNLASPEFSKISSLSKDLHVGNLNCSNPPSWADVEEGGFLLEDFNSLLMIFNLL